MLPTLEGIAHELLSLASIDCPINAIDLAETLGVEVCYSDVGETLLMGETIFVPRRVRLRRLHWLIAHELGHWAARGGGADSACCRVANYLGGALLLPRSTLCRQLRDGWDLERLCAEHPHAPAHAIAVRIVQLRGARAAVYDQGRVSRRWGEPLRDERGMVDEALATGRPVRVDDLTGAWPVIDGPWRRVIVLGEGL